MNKYKPDLGIDEVNDNHFEMFVNDQKGEAYCLVKGNTADECQYKAKRICEALNRYEKHLKNLTQWWGFLNWSGSYRVEKFESLEIMKDRAEMFYAKSYYGPFEAETEFEALQKIKKELEKPL